MELMKEVTEFCLMVFVLRHLRWRSVKIRVNKTPGVNLEKETN